MHVDETLGVCICLGRSERGQDHPDALAGEDLVEAGEELRIAVVDQEPDLAERSRAAEIARLLSDPAGARVRARAGEVDAPALKLDEEEHVVAAQEGGLNSEEVRRGRLSERPG